MRMRRRLRRRKRRSRGSRCRDWITSFLTLFDVLALYLFVMSGLVWRFYLAWMSIERVKGVSRIVFERHMDAECIKLAYELYCTHLHYACHRIVLAAYRYLKVVFG